MVNPAVIELSELDQLLDLSVEEFDRQVMSHRDRIEALFGQRPTTFRNTELVVSNEVASEARIRRLSNSGRTHMPLFETTVATCASNALPACAWQ